MRQTDPRAPASAEGLTLSMCTSESFNALLYFEFMGHGAQDSMQQNGERRTPMYGYKFYVISDLLELTYNSIPCPQPQDATASVLPYLPPRPHPSSEVATE